MRGQTLGSGLLDGCGVYPSSDVPAILDAVQEIARKCHDPRVGDWHALARLGRWLPDKETGGMWMRSPALASRST